MVERARTAGASEALSIQIFVAHMLSCAILPARRQYSLHGPKQKNPYAAHPRTFDGDVSSVVRHS